MYVCECMRGCWLDRFVVGRWRYSTDRVKYEITLRIESNYIFLIYTLIYFYILYYIYILFLWTGSPG